MLLNLSRSSGPTIRIAFPNSQEIIKSLNTEQTILVMGPPGPPGPAGSSATTLEYSVIASGQQNIVLSQATTSGILFLNGLMQSPSYYTLSGVALTIPAAMGVQPGDVINFTY